MQTPVAVVGSAQGLTPLFSIEVEQHVAKKLSRICTEQNVAMKDLVSTLLQRMLLDHRKETQTIVEKFRCRVV